MPDGVVDEALVLLIAAVIGLVVGGLTFLSGGAVAAAVLAGLTAAVRQHPRAPLTHRLRSGHGLHGSSAGGTVDQLPAGLHDRALLIEVFRLIAG
ncbi:hypothetical protein ACFY4K_34210 [Streptomyces leeuwenhoekii]|uniref:hypothetical protein n=1 Tax=Streptomyces leeuwenhoekii TaxID=1437453 RepID=UPI0036A04BFC